MHVCWWCVWTCMDILWLSDRAKQIEEGSAHSTICFLNSACKLHHWSYISFSSKYATHPIYTLQMHSDLRQFMHLCTYTLHLLDSIVCVCVWLCLCVCCCCVTAEFFLHAHLHFLFSVQEAASFSDSWSVSIFLLLFLVVFHVTSVWRVDWEDQYGGWLSQGMWNRTVVMETELVWVSSLSLSVCLSVPPKPVHLLPRGPVPREPESRLQGFHSSR